MCSRDSDAYLSGRASMATDMAGWLRWLVGTQMFARAALTPDHREAPMPRAAESAVCTSQRLDGRCARHNRPPDRDGRRFHAQRAPDDSTQEGLWRVSAEIGPHIEQFDVVADGPIEACFVVRDMLDDEHYARLGRTTAEPLVDVVDQDIDDVDADAFVDVLRDVVYGDLGVPETSAAAEQRKARRAALAGLWPELSGALRILNLDDQGVGP